MNAWKTSGKKGQRLRKKLGMTQGGSMEVRYSLFMHSCLDHTDLLIYYINVMPYDERRMIKKS